MGKLFAEHFVAAHQQVGDFKVTDGSTGAFYDSEVRYVFINRAGDRAIAVFQAEEDSGIADGWAYQSIDVSQIP